MAQFLSSGSVVDVDWYKSVEAKDFFKKVLHKKKRRQFGLLEAPVLSPLSHIDTVHYKVFISGKSGVGKSCLSARLAGVPAPAAHYETIGIETTVAYWPVKLRDNGHVVFFCLELWDCGENALRRFDHLLPSCKEQLDAVLYLFSFTDRSSFDDLPNQIAQSSDPPVKLVVGTKFDLFMHTDVTERDVQAFQQTCGIPVLRTGADGGAGLAEVAPILNTLAERLWYQDCVSVRMTTAAHFVEEA